MIKTVFWTVTLLFSAVFLVPNPSGLADERKSIPGAGWHYPYKDSFQEWKAPKEKYDPRMFDQEIIASYGHDAKDVEEIKDLLPESLYVILKDPKTWGKVRINVTEYKPLEGNHWDRYKEATQKYQGQSTIDEQGWLRNYKAGAPFPNPKDGLELAWNFKKRYSPDDRIFPSFAAVTNNKGQVRYLSVSGDLMFFNGRLSTDPGPLYEPNQDDLDQVDAYASLQPYELQGTLSVIKQFNDPNKEDELWMYLPVMRRVRHLSTTQRTDKLPGGQDLFWDNFDTFNGNVSLFNFKILGQKELLVVANGNPRGEFIEGEYLMGPNDYYQKVNCWVNEITSKDPKYPFSKIIQYLDPNTWIPYYSNWYDEKGQLKMASQFHYTYTENGIVMANVMNHTDIQSVHSSGYAFTNAVTEGNTYNLGLNADYFLLDNLRTIYPSR